MEAIIMELKEKTVKIKNVDTEKISYLHDKAKTNNPGDVISIKVKESNFSGGNLFLKGNVKKLNDSVYYFNECIKCGRSYNAPGKPLCGACWHSLKDNKPLAPREKMKDRTFTKDSLMPEEDSIYKDFRKKNPTNYRANDGHWVRSKSEKIIDDFLFRNRIVHVYEKRIPGERWLSDFYLPDYKIWIEHWGRDDEDYKKKRQSKTKSYQKHGFYDKLVETTEQEIQSAEDVLEEKLLKMGVKIRLE